MKTFLRATALMLSLVFVMTGFAVKCFSNQLTELDVSNNTALTSLYCGYNQLTELDVSGNTELTHLECYNNQFTKLDVSKNPKLTLDCGVT